MVRCLPLIRPCQLLDLIDELIEIIECPVYRCKAHIGDPRHGIQLLQRLLSDLLARDHVRCSCHLVDAVLYVMEDLLYIALRDAELLGALPDAALDLRDVERLMTAILLDDDDRFLLDALIAREPMAAFQALAPASYRGAITDLPLLQYLIIVFPAPWTSHGLNDSTLRNALHWKYT